MRGNDDARIHSGRDDRNGGAGACGRHSAESIFALAAAQGEGETAPSAIFRLALEIALALEKAAAGHKSVDGVHSRDAREET